MSQCTCANPTAVAKAIDDEKKQIKESSDEVNQTLYGSNMTNKEGGSAPGSVGTGVIVKNCRWAAPEYGGIGESAWDTAFKIASLTIAAANAVAQGQISDMQMDLAEKYYEMAEYKWERFRDKYMPLEKKLLAEVSNVPIRSIDCADADNRAVNSVNSAFDNIENYVARMAKSYRVCLDSSLLSYTDNRRNAMMVDTENFNLSDERWFTDFKNDQRWNRRGNVLNLGRNLSSTAMGYGDVANALMKQVGGQLDRAAGGVIQALGYYGARNDTFYPTSFLGSTSGSSGTTVIENNKNWSIPYTPYVSGVEERDLP